jgi:porphyrinogen peroxidase
VPTDREPANAVASASLPRPTPQAIVVPLTRDTIFLVLTIAQSADGRSRVRSLCADLSKLLRAVGFRDQDAKLTCVMGIGSEAWDRFFGSPRPAALHPFREIRSGTRHAVSTPGDLLFHIRAERYDLCFEIATLIMAELGDVVSSADEVHGFRYFDARDLLGFVDGTENPVGDVAVDAVLIGDEEPAFASGSYVIVQKYLHDLAAWNATAVETQEKIIGRTKLSDVELDDSVKPTSAHNALNTIVEDGKEVKILRENMVFGTAGQGEFGTYFIGYARSPRPIEQMLENMFVGRPPGNYDHILDFSRAVTGSLFFVPSLTFLDSVTPDSPAPAGVVESVSMEPAPVAASTNDGSLRIGSLKGRSRDE